MKRELNQKEMMRLLLAGESLAIYSGPKYENMDRRDIARLALEFADVLIQESEKV